MSRVMLLKTVGENGEAYGGFIWPLTVGAIVKPGQWDPDPKRECGAGLHGLLWGEGNGRLLSWEDAAKWLVVSADVDDVLPANGGKSRFRQGRVEFVGNRKDATDFLMANGASAHAVVGCYKTGGHSSTLMGGDFSALTGGNSSTLTGGDFSTLTGAYHSTLTGGSFSALAGGNSSTLTGGYHSTLTGGYHSTLTGGDFSTLTGGDFSTLIWRIWDDTHQRIFAFYVGEGGIKANVAYQLVDGKPQEVSK